MTTTITIQCDDGVDGLELKIGRRAAVPLRFFTMLLDAEPGSIFQLQKSNYTFGPVLTKWDFTKVESALSVAREIVE